MASISELKRIASQVRRDIIRQTHLADSGHPGGSLGCTEILTALYFEVMDLKEEFDMEGKDEDVFFLSNGYISPVWYSVLAHRGYFPVEELATFRRIDSRLQGHPTTHEGLPGIRVASGSLGQGLSVATGMAYAKKADRDEHVVFCLTGDGEQQEGQIWEAAIAAPNFKLGNLVVIVDRNHQQIDGSTDSVMDLGDIGAKWKAFNWEVWEMEGNDMEEVVNKLKAAKERALKGAQQPLFIVAHTEMGHGVDFMAGTHHWHGKATNAEQTEQALSQLEETLGDFPA